jgi:hypothetical protein
MACRLLAHPPALSGQIVRFTHHEHRQFRFAIGQRRAVDHGKGLAYGAHFRAREAMAQIGKQPRIADRLTRARRLFLPDTFAF